MALGKFNDRRLKFNKAQMRIISDNTVADLQQRTGLCEAACRKIRANKPMDYRISTLKMLAEGLNFESVADFLHVK